MRRLIVSILFNSLLCACMYGQTFSSDSTGADGEFNPPSQVPSDVRAEMVVLGDCTRAPGCTVTVPLREFPNHVFNFTTVTIGQFVTVKFRRNHANTPVFILAQGNVTISGTIDVSGQNAVPGLIAAQGGPGGFSGGLGSVPGSLTGLGGAGGGPGGGPGAGAGPEASCAQVGVGYGGGFGSPSSASCCFPPCAGGAPAYGTPELLPLIGGSGGGGGQHGGGGPSPGGNGGGGGGAILIASSGVTHLGSGSSNAIIAKGGDGEQRPFNGHGGGGSGGAIRLLATTLRGSRGLNADRGRSFAGEAGTGRIRLEAVRLDEYFGPTSPQATFGEPGQPGPVFPPITPTVRLVSVAGAMVPDPPTADVSTADLTLPPTFTNPVPVVVEAMHVPSGTQARVIVAPQLGAGPRTITPVTLTGQPRRATANVTIPTRGVGIISAVIDTVVPEP